jgi:hypothetical protein
MATHDLQGNPQRLQFLKKETQSDMQPLASASQGKPNQPQRLEFFNKGN